MNSALVSKIRNLLHASMELIPTDGQSKFIDTFSRFAADDSGGIFILKGYAGTGKTTMMSAVTRVFNNIVLLAPTGRAAKVLSNYTGKAAYTIHKHLYIPATTSDGRMWLRPAENKFHKTLFIVDEASMIPDAAIEDEGSVFPGVNLLTDLISYVYSGRGCRLMLVGDTAQLPPVHFDTSPALDADHLKYRFRREVYQTELTEVVRQKNDSGILYNATHIREHIREEDEHIEFDLNGYKDIVRVTGNDLVDLMHTVYKEEGKENVLLITRSNKSAIQYNRLIRFNQMWMENEIDAGDQLMVVKNNYHWIDEEHPANFIANGDVIEVQKIHRFEDVFNCRFALATIKLNDYPNEPAIEAYLLLDTLSSEAPALSKEQQNKLYNALQDYYAAEEPDKRRRSALIRKDPYYNALQIKFAYAVTCYKSQGGQWPVVFVDQGYFTEDMLNIEYLRWLYTAITRASKKVYLLNFSDSFFQN